MLCIVGQKKFHTYSTNWTVIFGLASTHTHTEITFNGKTHGIVMCNDRHLPYWICHTQIAKRRPKIVFFLSRCRSKRQRHLFVCIYYVLCLKKNDTMYGTHLKYKWVPYFFRFQIRNFIAILAFGIVWMCHFAGNFDVNCVWFWTDVFIRI